MEDNREGGIGLGVKMCKQQTLVCTSLWGISSTPAGPQWTGHHWIALILFLYFGTADVLLHSKDKSQSLTKQHPPCCANKH